MADLLSDRDLKKLLGSVIKNGDQSCLRPNSYILRLGSFGEFLNATKEFNLGKAKKGIKIQPGHSVAVTAFEELDFSRKTIQEIFPDCDLHGIVSPTTDLSREGIVAPTTQIDSGFKGSLNWTISNTSNEERRFLFKEKIFRLSIFKLEKGERASVLYDGDYQGKTGYVRSMRKGAPIGMKDSEWEDSVQKDSPEELLDNLMKSGYPWHTLGQRLKMIDQQLKTVTDEYDEISKSINNLNEGLNRITDSQQKIAIDLPLIIRSALKDETTSLQNRWLIGAGALMFAIFGLILSITSSDRVLEFLKNNGPWIGFLVLFSCVVVLYFISRRRSNNSS